MSSRSPSLQLDSHQRLLVGLMIYLLDQDHSIGQMALDDLGDEVSLLQQQMDIAAKDCQGATAQLVNRGRKPTVPNQGAAINSSMSPLLEQTKAAGDDLQSSRDEDENRVALARQLEYARKLLGLSRGMRQTLGYLKDRINENDRTGFLARLQRAEGLESRQDGKRVGLLAHIARLEEFHYQVEQTVRTIVRKGIWRNEWEEIEAPFGIVSEFWGHRTYVWLNEYYEEEKRWRGKLADLRRKITWLLEWEPELDKIPLSAQPIEEEMDSPRSWVMDIQQKYCRNGVHSIIECHSLLEHIPYRLEDMISMDDPEERPATDEYDKLEVMCADTGRPMRGATGILEYVRLRIAEINRLRSELTLLLPGDPVQFPVPTWKQLTKAAKMHVQKRVQQVEMASQEQLDSYEARNNSKTTAGIAAERVLDIPDWSTIKKEIDTDLDQGLFHKTLGATQPSPLQMAEASPITPEESEPLTISGTNQPEVQKVEQLGVFERIGKVKEQLEDCVNVASRLSLSGQGSGLAALLREVANEETSKLVQYLSEAQEYHRKATEKAQNWNIAWADFADQKAALQSGWLRRSWMWLRDGVWVTQESVKEAYLKCHSICPEHKTLLALGRDLGFEPDPDPGHITQDMEI